MKPQKWLLFLVALGAATLFTGGCSSVPSYAGDLFYYDAGCTWWWREGLGWRYAGFHGRGSAPEPRLHCPPPSGQLPPHQPGQPPPRYYFLAKDGSVLVSLDGKSFRDAGNMVGAGFVPNVTLLTSSHVAWYPGGFGSARKGEVSGSSFHLAARPVGGVRQVLDRAASVFSNSGSSHGGWSSTGSSFSGRTSDASRGGGWSHNEGGGGWSGGGGGGSFSHSSGGGISGGGGGGGGGSHGGGGGGGGGGNHGRWRSSRFGRNASRPSWRAPWSTRFPLYSSPNRCSARGRAWRPQCRGEPPHRGF